MKSTISITGRSRTGEATPCMERICYKTIAIYPNFSDIGNAFALLINAGFTSNKISLLGREQEHWKARLRTKWETLNTETGALEGTAVGAFPGLMLVAGVHLTGGVGLLAAGPMIAVLEALGMGALSGTLMGSAMVNLNSTQEEVNIQNEMGNAICLGQWVIVAHSHDEGEALRALALLPNSRIIREADLGSMQQ